MSEVLCSKIKVRRVQGGAGDCGSMFAILVTDKSSCCSHRRQFVVW